MISLKAFDTRTLADTGVEIELLSLVDGRPSGAFIRVHGSDSRVFRDIQIENAREAQERGIRRVSPLTPDEIDERNIQTLARCTLGWRGIDDAPEFSKEAAADIYRSYPGIREQISVAIADRANFTHG